MEICFFSCFSIIFIPLVIINIVFLLKSKQTIIIKNNKIVCKNIFGKIIDEIEFVNVKLAYTQNICVFSVKMHHIYRPFIIISRYKTKKTNLENYSNKKGYIVIPNISENKIIIETEYEKSTKNSLCIK